MYLTPQSPNRHHRYLPHILKLQDCRTYRNQVLRHNSPVPDALSGIPSKSGGLINIRAKTVTKRVLPDFYLKDSVEASMRCEEDERSSAKRTASAKMCIIGIEMEKKPFKKRPLNVRKKCSDTGCHTSDLFTR